MKLLEKLEKHLHWSRELCTMKDGSIQANRFAYFEPLTLADMEEAIEALRK